MVTRTSGAWKAGGYLVVLALICGVLAMHALTVGHDPVHSPGTAAASEHLPATAHGTDASALAGMHDDELAAPVAQGRQDMSAAMAAATPCGGGCGEPAGPGGNHSTTVMCLAVLGVLGACAVLWLALVSRRLEPPDRTASAASGAGWWQPPLFARPRPYSLGVLRT